MPKHESSVILLSLSELIELLNQLFDKYWQKYPSVKPQKFNVEKDIMLWMIGHDPKSKKPSIITLLKDDPLIKKYLKEYNEDKENSNKNAVDISSNQLYSMKRAIEEKDEQYYQLRGIHADIYFIYLGYKEKGDKKYIDDFRSAFKEKMPSFKFKGYYFSTIHKEVLFFDIAFTKLSDTTAEAVFVGFHDKHKEVELTGTASMIENAWTMHLVNKGIFVNLIIDVGNFNQNSFKVLIENNNFFGIISGINSNNKLFSAEFLLLNDHTVESQNNLLFAKRYLNLQRHHFTTALAKKYDIKKLDRLQVGNTLLNNFRGLAGKTFRILMCTFFSKKISQAKLEIRNDFSCIIRYPDKEDGIVELRCTLSANDNHASRLFIEAYYEETLYAFTTIEIAQVENNTYLSCAYCMIPLEFNMNATGGIFHMVEVEDDDEFPDEEIKFYNIKDYTKAYTPVKPTLPLTKQARAVRDLLEILKKYSLKEEDFEKE